MRNKITIIVCLLLVVLVATMAVACVQRDADGLIKLSTPKNLELNGSVLSWDEVKNAEEYFISINGEELEQSVTTTVCDLSTLVKGYGDFTIAVRAYGDGVKYGTSDKSKTITYHKGNSLDVPDIIIDDSLKTATWGPIDRAVNYSVKVVNVKGNTLDEVTIEATEGLEKYSYSFDKEIYEGFGEYIISVVANPSSEDIEYSPSLAGVKSFYNATVLATPEWNTMSATTITWKAVSAGEGYSVTYTLIMEDEEGNVVGDSGELTSTSYAYRTKFTFDEAGKYIFRIRANGDDSVYKTSPYSEINEDFTVTKLAPVEAQDVVLTYGSDGTAKLKWSIDATNEAYEFTLNLNTYLPNGSEVLSDSNLKKTISNKLVLVTASTYDFYQYDDSNSDGVAKVDGRTILVYNYEQNVKVRYNGVDYVVVDTDGNDITKYSHNSLNVDIIFDSDKNQFVYEVKAAHDDEGKLVDQDTGADKVDVVDGSKQLYYWDSVDGESDISVVRDVVYSGNEIVKHTFELTLDDIFINPNPTGEEGKYTINDERFYGKLYDVSLSTARNDSNKFILSESVKVDGQYMSYKIPENRDGKYIVSNSGEYAYIIRSAFVNASNTNYYSIEGNVDFDGYEIAQISSFRGTIDGNGNTVSNIVIGNKVLTASGVIANDNQETLQYAMFVNIASGATIKDVFYVGMGFNSYDVEELGEDVKAIQVAPIAIANSGSISDVLVQIDSIKAESADVAGMVITNNGSIATAYVYATLEGRNVGGVIINNNAGASVSNSGFYGKVTATVGKVLDEDTAVTQISGAGFVVNNSGTIEGSFSIGAIDDNDKTFVTVTAEHLEGIYAGGFAAVNSGTITKSYSGEFTLNNITATVTANGNNAIAGGFVAINSGNISSSYATNEGAGSVAGGFVGNHRSGSITSSYSTGGALGADENSANRGAFVGRSEGTIANSVSYSRDGSNKVVEGVTAVSDLDAIVDVLYTGASADMALLREQGYRNPIINGLIYTKDNTATVRPGQTGDDLSDLLTRVALSSDVDGASVTVTVHGDNTGRGNKIVIELSSNDAAASRYIYAYVQ